MCRHGAGPLEGHVKLFANEELPGLAKWLVGVDREAHQSWAPENIKGFVASLAFEKQRRKDYCGCKRSMRGIGGGGDLLDYL